MVPDGESVIITVREEWPMIGYSSWDLKSNPWAQWRERGEKRERESELASGVCAYKEGTALKNSVCRLCLVCLAFIWSWRGNQGTHPETWTSADAELCVMPETQMLFFTPLSEWSWLPDQAAERLHGASASTSPPQSSLLSLQEQDVGWRKKKYHKATPKVQDLPEVSRAVPRLI